MQEKYTFLDNMKSMINKLFAKDNSDHFIKVYSPTGKDFIFGKSVGDVIIGTNRDEIIDGGKGSDVINGGSGDDTLLGGEGNDLLWGGKGNDLLAGEGGDDFYYFSRTDGQDVIDDRGGTNDTLFLKDLRPAALRIRKVCEDLEIGQVGLIDTITIKGWFTSPGKPIENILCDDGKMVYRVEIETALAQLLSAASAFSNGNPGVSNYFQPPVTPLTVIGCTSIYQ